MANLSKTLHINFYQNRSSIVEVIIKKLVFFMPHSIVSLDVCTQQNSQGFSGEGASNDSGVIENVDFQRFWTLGLRHLRK